VWLELRRTLDMCRLVVWCMYVDSTTKDSKRYYDFTIDNPKSNDRHLPSSHSSWVGHRDA
jgi:hypothetical protein